MPLIPPPVAYAIPGSWAAAWSAAPAWLKAAIDLSAKGAALLLAAWALTAALRRAPAALRHLTWLAAMAGLLVLPVLGHALPAWRIKARVEQAAVPAPVARVARAPAVAAANRAATTDVVTDVVPVADEMPLPAAVPPPLRPVDPLPARPAWRLAWWAWLGIAWLAGSLAFLVPLAAGVIAAARIARRARRCADPAWSDMTDLVHAAAAEMGLARPPALLLGAAGSMPMTLGLFRPAVLLPEDAAAWPAQRRRVVLIHELAHVRRRDCLTQLIGRVACAVHWFNPLAWLAVHRLRAEQEQACDDLVLAAGARPSDYA
jgi:beta-lactamase regulating signal transducer with metallopeptidase domain